MDVVILVFVCSLSEPIEFSISWKLLLGPWVVLGYCLEMVLGYFFKS